MSSSAAAGHRTVPAGEPARFQVKALRGAVRDPAGLLECAAVTTGFMLIQRRVIAGMVDTLIERAYVDAESGQTLYDLFQTGLIPSAPAPALGPEWWPEDHAFCDPARRCGFCVWLVPDLTMTHTGRHVWTGRYTEQGG